MRMRLSARHDENRAVGTAGGAAVAPVAEEDERGAWGEGRTRLVYRSRLPPRHTLTLDATPEALLYHHTPYPPCAYRWRDIVRTSPDENPISGAWFILSVGRPSTPPAPPRRPRRPASASSRPASCRPAVRRCACRARAPSSTW